MTSEFFILLKMGAFHVAFAGKGALMR